MNCSVAYLAVSTYNKVSCRISSLDPVHAHFWFRVRPVLPLVGKNPYSRNFWAFVGRAGLRGATGANAQGPPLQGGSHDNIYLF